MLLINLNYNIIISNLKAYKRKLRRELYTEKCLVCKRDFTKNQIHSSLWEEESTCMIMVARIFLISKDKSLKKALQGLIGDFKYLSSLWELTQMTPTLILQICPPQTLMMMSAITQLSSSIPHSSLLKEAYLRLTAISLVLVIQIRVIDLTTSKMKQNKALSKLKDSNCLMQTNGRQILFISQYSTKGSSMKQRKRILLDRCNLQKMIFQ